VCVSPSASPCARRIAGRVQRFQHPELFRPDLILTLPNPRILISPESTGRASGRRPDGFRGWSSGKRLSVALGGDPRDGPGQVPLSRDEAQAAADRRTRQAWAEIAQAVRRGRQLSARRGPPSERVKNPRSEGFRITTARSARTSSKRYSHQSYSGRGPGASHPSHQAQRGFLREITPTCPHLAAAPPVRPHGGRSARSEALPPLGEDDREAIRRGQVSAPPIA